MLAAGSAEYGERVSGHVVAALHRDALDRLGHVADGDFDEPGSHLFCGLTAARCVFNALRQFRESAANDLAVERRVAARAEHVRKELRLDATEHHIGIRHRQWPAAPVAGRTRVGTGRIRPDAQARAIEVQDRAAPRRHGVDTHHRRPHAHAGNKSLELTLVLAGIVRNVGRRAAHVEADDVPEPSVFAGPGHADDAAGRARQDRVLTLETPGVSQAAVALHEEQARARHVFRHLLDVAAQDGRQVRIDDRGVAARHQLHQWAHLVRDGDLRKAGFARDLRGGLLMRGVAITVHEDDRARAQSGVVRLAQCAAQRHAVERLQHLAVRAGALVGLDDPGIKQLRQHDLAFEQARPVLVGDAQRIAKPARDDEHRRLALALEQRIGRHRGTHLDRGDAFGRDRCTGGDAEQVADTGDRGVAILLRIVRQQLVRDE